MSGQIDLAGIEQDPSVIFVLDREYRLRWCNAAWDRFARENNGEELLRDLIVGRSVFDFISGVLTDHYREAFRRTLERGVIWKQDYECSSSHVHRQFSMCIYPVDGELLIVNSLVANEPHGRHALLSFEAHYRDSNGLLVMCSNCRRTKIGSVERWDWVPDFVDTPPNQVTHGLCQPCYEYYSSMIGL